MGRIGSLLAIALASALPAVLAPAAWAQTPVYGGHLRVAVELPPTSLDPAVGRSGGDAFFWRQTFDQLVGSDPLGAPRAATSLAESWEFPNPTTIVFHLRKGVKFHDGTSFDAQAVKFNIDRIQDPKLGATPRAGITTVKSVEVLDPYTVKFNLAAPWGPGLAYLSDRGGAMGSPAAISKLGLDYGFHPVGTGPFKLAEFVAGSYARFVRNPDYWGRDEQGRRLPYLDELTINIIKDQSVEVAGLRAGELDMIGAPPQELQALKNDPRFNIASFPGSGVAYLLVFNARKPPLDNVNLRLAISYAIDPEPMVKAVYANGGSGMVARAGMWPDGTWVFDPTVSRPHYDPAKAREYLKLGGKPAGFTVDAVSWTQDQLQQDVEITKEQLAAVGITLNIQTLSVGAATSQFFEAPTSPPLFLTSWSRYAEPDYNATLNYKSDGYYNPSKLPRPDLDRLIEAGAHTYNLEERKKAYRKVNEIMLGEALYVPILYAVGNTATPKKVQGLETLFGSDAKWDFRRIWIKP